MSLLNTTVYLRNDSDEKIDIGDIKLKVTESVLIFDSINYSDAASTALAQVVANIAVFNENIGNGGLVMVYNFVDQTPEQAWSIFHQLTSFDPNSYSSNTDSFANVVSIMKTIEASGTSFQLIKAFNQQSAILYLKFYNDENKRYSTVQISLYNSLTYFTFLNDYNEYSDLTLLLTNSLSVRFQMISGVLNLSIEKHASDFITILDYQTQYNFVQFSLPPAYASLIIGTDYQVIGTIALDTDSANIIEFYIGIDNKVAKHTMSYKNVSGTVSIVNITDLTDFVSEYSLLLTNNANVKFTAGTNSLIIQVLQNTSVRIASLAYQLGGL